MAVSGIVGTINPFKMFTLPESASALLKSQQKAKIVTVKKDGGAISPTDARYVELEFQFNPAELKISKSVKWEAGKIPPARNAPDLKFGGGESAKFDLKFLFDTSQVGLIGTRDVRTYTQELLRLVMVHGPIDDREEPPCVKFQWGTFVLFLAVVEKVDVTYTLFDPDGTPIRAEATVSLVQQDKTDDFPGSMNPTTRTEARKTRMVRQGERLDVIAYQEYGSAAYWRHLAEANGLSDPRALQPGQILSIPPLP
ncbi:MAG: LysM peptidoglycan-binding domain-containing protein [Anaerolineae bacterium]|nr:LysM peptidoglycan-binding domain-containing protein [Anaerolineae bacterium]